MPLKTDYHCRNCGHNFTIQILTKDEAEKARDKGEYVGPVACPRCQRTDLIRLSAAA